MRDAKDKRRGGFLVGRFALCAFHFALCIPSSADDRVTVRTGSGAGTIILTGHVVDWTGETLQIRVGDDVRQVSAETVTGVQTSKAPKHVDGLKALEAGKPADANKLLAEALAEEPREWMRREILAALTRVDLARGDRAAAMTDFLALVESDPATPHFRVIPLDWGTNPPDAAAASIARPWLRSGGSDVERLLGASVLLFDSADGEVAFATLNKLATVADRRIFTLARAQMWRRTLARGNVPEGEIERWEDRVNEAPEPLRGGVYSLIGRAWADAGNPERAAAALLWLPLVYDIDTPLAAESAFAAANELSRIGRTADAVVLYREVLARFPYAPAAAEARATLDRLAAESAPRNSQPPVGR
jgi:tetratricopeptide (TPR) repeat protein